MSAGTTLDRPWQIYCFGLLQIKHRLNLEINTGMTFRTSTLRMANHVMGTNFRTKVQALEEFNKRYEQMRIFFGLVGTGEVD